MSNGLIKEGLNAPQNVRNTIREVGSNIIFPRDDYRRALRFYKRQKGAGFFGDSRQFDHEIVREMQSYKNIMDSKSIYKNEINRLLKNKAIKNMAIGGVVGTSALGLGTLLYKALKKKPNEEVENV